MSRYKEVEMCCHGDISPATINMKSLLLSSLLFSSAFAGAVPRAEGKVDYSGFKVVRLELAAKSAKLEAQIEELAAHVLNPGTSSVLDVVVSPDKVKAVSALASKSTVINNDVGKALEEEGGFSAYAGRSITRDGAPCTGHSLLT